MKKDGLTLVELLAVIAIIGLLAVMITPGVVAVRKSVLRSTYSTRVSQIENAAKDYASDHINLIPQYVPDNEILTDEKLKNDDYKKVDYKCCATVSVNYLISSGYLAATNSYVTSDGQKKENQIMNPITGESMNNMVVCFRYTSNDAMNRDIVAFLMDDTSLEELNEAG